MRAALAALALSLLAAGAAAQQPAEGPSLLAADVPSSFGHYRPPAAYTEQIRQTFYLPLRDGTRVAMLLTRPARDGKPVEGRFPVIWHHSLSASQELEDGVGPRSGGFRAIPTLTNYGYVVVQVARRGNGQSFGTMRGYHGRNEAHVAYELI